MQENTTSSPATASTSNGSPDLQALQTLAHNINITRRSRMNAANRLIALERFIQSANIYYSCFTVIVSIVSLIRPNEMLSLMSVLLTCILAISIVYLNAQRFGQRSQQFHNNHLGLYKLYSETQAAIRAQDTDKLLSLEEQYITLLEAVENHIEQDFARTLHLNDRIGKRNNKSYARRLRGWEHASYHFHNLLFILLRLFIWIIPLICVIYILYAWSTF